MIAELDAKHRALATVLIAIAFVMLHSMGQSLSLAERSLAGACGKADQSVTAACCVTARSTTGNRNDFRLTANAFWIGATRKQQQLRRETGDETH